MHFWYDSDHTGWEGLMYVWKENIRQMLARCITNKVCVCVVQMYLVLGTSSAGAHACLHDNLQVMPLLLC